MRQIVSKFLGLMTTPNKFGVLPPGAMQQANNVCLRAPGVISTMPASRQLRLLPPTSTDTIRRMFDMSQIEDLLWVVDDAYSLWAVDAATANPLQFTYGGVANDVDFDETSWIQSTVSRTRAILTNSAQPVISDDVSSDLRLAGLPPPGGIFISLSASNATTWANNTTAAWCARFRRVFDDGYEPFGPPSQAVANTNASGGTRDASLSINWGYPTVVQAGDFIDVYRTAFSTTTETGTTFYFVGSHEITAAEATACLATFVDYCLPNAVGAELYTNPGQEGPTAGNFTPPPSNDCCTFAGSVLYASTASHHVINSSIPNTVGNLSTAAERLRGIGERDCTGSTVIATPTITGVASTNGVVFGQEVISAQFAAGTRVVSKTVNTITCNTNATATAGPSVHRIIDVMEIDGVRRTIDFAWVFFPNLAFASHVVAFTDKILNQDTTPTNLAGLQFVLMGHTPFSGSFTVRATNGQNYSPALPEISATVQTSTNDPRTNRVHHSKPEQPEAVPLLNYFFVGHGVIIRLVLMRSCVLAFCTDGLYRITGDGVNWAVDLVDPEIKLLYKNAVDVMNGSAYAATNQGLIAVQESGAFFKITDGVIDELWGQLREGLYGQDLNTARVFLTCNENQREVWLSFMLEEESGTSTTTIVYSTKTEALWTIDAEQYTATTYARWMTNDLNSVITAFHAPLSSPEVRYFEAVNTVGYMDDASILMQPITGSGLDSSKQWTDIKMLCGSTNFKVRPKFPNEAANVLTFVQRGGRREWEYTCWVHREDALNPSMEFGFDTSLAITGEAVPALSIYALNYGWEEDSEEAGSP